MRSTSIVRAAPPAMVLAHVSRCFMTELVVDERRPAVSAESDDLAPAWAKFGGLSGKIRIMSWERLGEEVRLRRKQLKLTQPDLAERGGLSVATIRAVETNRAGRLSRRLRRALERAIDWEAGSIDTVLEGGTPRVLGTSAAMGAPRCARRHRYCRSRSRTLRDGSNA